MAEEKRQDTSEQASTPTLNLNDRVREALRTGLRALVASEVSKIDAIFEQTERVLLAAYKGFRPTEVPADLRMVLRDLHVFRDKHVEEMTFKATEDFRLAMERIEWAIEESEKKKVATAPAAPSPAVPGAAAPAAAPTKKPIPKMPPGLTDEERRSICKAILEQGPVRTSVLRQSLQLEAKSQPLKLFVRWLRDMGMATTEGVKSGMTFAATDKMQQFLAPR